MRAFDIGAWSAAEWTLLQTRPLHQKRACNRDVVLQFASRMVFAHDSGMVCSLNLPVSVFVLTGWILLPTGPLYEKVPCKRSVMLRSVCLDPRPTARRPVQAGQGQAPRPISASSISQASQARKPQQFHQPGQPGSKAPAANPASQSTTTAQPASKASQASQASQDHSGLIGPVAATHVR